MAKFGQDVRPYWPKIGGRGQEFLIISEPTEWTSHWDPRVERTRKCGGPGCPMCHVGCKKQLRVVIMCVDGNGRDALIELRERHRQTFDSYESTVGLRISIRRAGVAKNSPIELKVVGEGFALARNIDRLVASFGLDVAVDYSENEDLDRVGRMIDGLRDELSTDPDFGDR